jgi:FkbM family methyltransferase
MKRARLPDGTSVWCDVPLGASAVWNEIQTYFPDEERVRGGEVVFDVGANIGLFSLAAWKQSAGQARIFSFEPMPSTCAICQANAREFDSSRANWQTLRAGLGAREETAMFHHFTHLSVLSGRVRDRKRAFEEMDRALSAPRLGAPLEIFNLFPAWSRRLSGALVGQFLLRSRPVAATVWTVSSAMRRLNVATLDWLKIDVEGAELDVLRGVERADWPRIRRVLLEAENAEQERQARALLESVGFEVETRDNPVFAGHDLKMMFASR